MGQPILSIYCHPTLALSATMAIAPFWWLQLVCVTTSLADVARLMIINRLIVSSLFMFPCWIEG